MLARGRLGAGLCPGSCQRLAINIHQSRAWPSAAKQQQLRRPYQPISDPLKQLLTGKSNPPLNAKPAVASAVNGVDATSIQRPSELQLLINSIPFRKLALWALVGVLAAQLTDFFGVSGGYTSAGSLSLALFDSQMRII
jgi:hypothetical protein